MVRLRECFIRDSSRGSGKLFLNLISFKETNLMKDTDRRDHR